MRNAYRNIGTFGKYVGNGGIPLCNLKLPLVICFWAPKSTINISSWLCTRMYTHIQYYINIYFQMRNIKTKVERMLIAKIYINWIITSCSHKPSHWFHTIHCKLWPLESKLSMQSATVLRTIQLFSIGRYAKMVTLI